MVQVLDIYADNETLAQLSYLDITLGVIAVMVGTVGLYRNITTGGAAAWASTES